MKNNSVCPKCGSDKILAIGGGSVDSEESLPAGMLTRVPVAIYVCGRCGFIEHWIANGRDLKSLIDYHGTGDGIVEV